LKNDSHLTWEQAVLWMRQQPDQANLVRDCFYDDPLQESAERFYRSSEWRAVRRLLAAIKPGDVLDLGAGRGISSYALARDGWKVTALEPDRSSVVGAGAIRLLAEETKLDITVIENRWEQLPSSVASFDLVYARQMLHHSADLLTLCKEVSRVLKPQGLFIATREHVISKKEDLQEFLDSHHLHHLYGGEHAYLLSEYINAIEQSGIKLTDVLNPLQSEINLFPDTKQMLKYRLAKIVKLPWPGLIPDTFLTLLGLFNRTPGRLYTFVGRKVV
jgi:2-polyprenyl-3-methyl-5-hydroxy-6-metoxy-1,4-benzoquinol methylase